MLFKEVQRNHLFLQLYSRDFFIFDSESKSFFSEGTSTIVEKLVQSHHKFQTDVKKIKEQVPEQKALYRTAGDIENSELLYYKKIVDAINLTKELGYKDWGLEGQWRNSIHTLEESFKNRKNNDKFMLLYLQLRRHEKDYLLRHEPGYIQEIKNVLSELKKKIIQDTKSYSENSNLIDNYDSALENYVNKYQTLSDKKNELEKIENDLNHKMNTVEGFLEKEILEYNLKNLVFVGFFLLCLIIVFYFLIKKHAQTLLEPINKMKMHFEQVGLGNFDCNLELRRDDEFKILEQEFNLMLDNLKAACRQTKMISLGEASAAIAHDIASPLTVALGVTDLMVMKLEKSPSGNLQEVPLRYTETINRSLQRIHKIISSVTKLARESNSMEFKPISLNSVINEALFFMDFKLQKNRITIRGFDQNTSDLYFHGDETLISQAFVNLISNAADAIAELPEKWIDISVKENPDNIEISFTDSGHGLPQEIKEKLFKVFLSTKDEGKGTGLGLLIIKKVIEQHSGVIYLKDGPNTCFVIRLPKENTKVQIDKAS
ncbi:MAG: ATP-binding protein [Bdellovibrio sp.]